MKEEINNEMDALLRRLSRRDGTAGLDGSNSSLSDHLDADELNAYSENTLPSKTRLRYTEHLADCARCRSLVTQLTQSAGLELPGTEKPQSSWLASFLGKLVTPFTLRYALPVLAAIGIVAIGLIVLRREPAGMFTAQKADHSQSKTVDVPQSNQSSTGFHDGKLNSESQTTPTTEGVAEGNKSQPIAQQKSSTDAVASDRVEPAAPAAPKDQSAVAVAAPESIASGAAQTRTDVSKLDDAERQQKTEDLKKAKQAEEDRDKVAAAKEPVVNQRRVDELRGASPDAANRPAKENYQVGTGVSSVFSAGRSKREGKEEESKNESETRTVEGHQFRKQGNLWMDTAYNSSIRTLTVVRGSESYRSLIADEPAIRTIAEQLDGEIVVVWKGKAYRIR